MNFAKGKKKFFSISNGKYWHHLKMDAPFILALKMCEET